MWVVCQDGMDVIESNRFNVEQSSKGFALYAYGPVVVDDCNYIKIADFDTKEEATKEFIGICKSIDSGKNIYVISGKRVDENLTSLGIFTTREIDLIRRRVLEGWNDAMHNKATARDSDNEKKWNEVAEEYIAIFKRLGGGSEC